MSSPERSIHRNRTPGGRAFVRLLRAVGLPLVPAAAGPQLPPGNLQPCQRTGKPAACRRAAALQVCFAAVFLLAAPARAAIAPGDPLPNLAAYQLTGDIPNLAGKVVLVDVWASWCAPCKASFPAFSALQAELVDEGFVILAVSVDRKESAYMRFVESHQPGFATVLDSGQRLVAELAPPAMPTSYLFGRDGRLRSMHSGFHGDKTIDELRAEITRLLNDSSS